MKSPWAAGPIRAVAFDLDGTLLDTLPDIAAASNAMLVAIGRDPVPEGVVRGYIGDGVARLTKRLLTASRDGEPDAKVFDRALGIFEEHYLAGVSERTRPFEGVIDGLALLAGRRLRLACITNKAIRFTEPLLAAQGLAACFDLVLGGDSLPRKKPDPLPLLHCCERLGIQPDEMLYVGDSSNDVAAARAAGCPVVCVSYGYCGDVPVRDLGADAIVADILEVGRSIA
ncbi:MAG: phosphoglycolate phosphatase [Betaproteobacteria bacterium]